MSDHNPEQVQQILESMVRTIARAVIEAERLGISDAAVVLRKAGQAAQRETDARRDVASSAPWQATMR